MNNMHRSIDMIPKNNIIFNWHYERVEPRSAYFTLKGFDVDTSSWRNGSVAKEQLVFLGAIRKNSNKETTKHIKVMLHASCSSASSFLERFYAPIEKDTLNDAACFKMLFEK